MLARCPDFLSSNLWSSFASDSFLLLRKDRSHLVRTQCTPSFPLKKCSTGTAPFIRSFSPSLTPHPARFLSTSSSPLSFLSHSSWVFVYILVILKIVSSLPLFSGVPVQLHRFHYHLLWKWFTNHSIKLEPTQRKVISNDMLNPALSVQIHSAFLLGSSHPEREDRTERPTQSPFSTSVTI